MTGTSEISDKLTAALEQLDGYVTAKLQAEHHAVVASQAADRLSQAIAALVEASGGKRRFTRDGETHVAHKSKDGMWSLREPRVQKGVEA